MTYYFITDDLLLSYVCSGGGGTNISAGIEAALGLLTSDEARPAALHVIFVVVSKK